MGAEDAADAASRLASLLDASEESFEKLLRVNLQGPYFLTQAVARFMLEQKERDRAWAGAIVNVTSVSATMVSLNRGEYCVSKAGLAMASQLWAVRLAPHGIPVYEVRPGIVRTDMTAGVTAKYDALIGEGLVPQQRWGITAGVEAEGDDAVGVKNGWYPGEEGWRVNSVGIVRLKAGAPYAIAVMTGARPSWREGIETIEGIAAKINADLRRER